MVREDVSSVGTSEEGIIAVLTSLCSEATFTQTAARLNQFLPEITA